MPLKPRTPVPSDIEIAQEADLRPILEIADKLDLTMKTLTCLVSTRPRSISTFSRNLKTVHKANMWM